VIQEKDKFESVNQIATRNTDLITQEMTKHKNDHSGHQVHRSKSIYVAVFFLAGLEVPLTRGTQAKAGTDISPPLHERVRGFQL
jgi:hypothetical protein